MRRAGRIAGIVVIVVQSFAETRSQVGANWVGAS